MAKFQKGQSGNPGGRPKESQELKLLAQSKTEEAVKTLASIMSSKKSPAAARVSAACALLDRGYGKPTQMIEGMVPTDPIGDQDIMELARRVAFMLHMGAMVMDKNESPNKGLN